MIKEGKLVLGRSFERHVEHGDHEIYASDEAAFMLNFVSKKIDVRCNRNPAFEVNAFHRLCASSRSNR